MAEVGLVHGREQQGGTGGRRCRTWAPAGGWRRHKSTKGEREVSGVSGAACRGCSVRERAKGESKAAREAVLEEGSRERSGIGRLARVREPGWA